MKRKSLALAAVLICWIGSGCSNAPGKPQKASLNLQPVRLATIPADQDATEFYISEDGHRAAYVVKKNGKVCLVSDGKESEEFDDLHRVVFSPGSRSIAFRAMSPGAEYIVINGKREKKYGSIGNVQFAPDGRIVYEAQERGKWRIVAGRKESPEFDMPFIEPLISSSGESMAYYEQHYASQKINIVVCTLDMTKRTKGNDYDSIRTIKRNLAGTRLVYIAGKNGRHAVVTADFNEAADLKEQEGRWHDDVYTVDISRDGDHTAYLARDGKLIYLIKDGVEMPFAKHDKRSHLVISKKGRTFNIGVLGGRFFPIIDGKKAGREYDEITMPAFDQEGTNLAFAARRRNEWFVVANGHEGPAFDMVVTPTFSPDGLRLAYRARRNGERFVVVADLQGRTLREHPRYEMVWEPVFSPDGKSICYGVKTGQELWWKVEQLEKT